MTILQKIRRKAGKLSSKEIDRLHKENRRARTILSKLGGYETIAKHSIFSKLSQDTKEKIFLD